MAGHVRIQERYIMARLRYNSEMVRQMYNDAVKKINRKLRELEKRDPDAISVMRYKGCFKPITTEKPNYKTAMELYKSAMKVLESGELTLKSNERRLATTVETFNRMGYTFVNRENVISLIMFLEDAKARGLAGQYSSARLAEAWETITAEGMSEEEIKKNMEYWQKNMKKDKKGRTIEVENPAPLKVRRYAGRRK